MAASNVSDIPDYKPVGKYCPCKNCQISREEGRQEIRKLILELHTPTTDGGCGDLDCCSPDDSEEFCSQCQNYEYPCPTIKAIESK